MKQRFIYLLKYYLFWIFYFILIKTLFLLFNFHQTLNLSCKELMGVFFYGFRLDLSMSSYLVFLAVFLSIALLFLKKEIFKKTLKIITLLCLIIASFIAIVDFELYQYWGFRLDTTPLTYLNTPEVFVTSVSWFIVVRQFLVGIALCWLFLKIYQKWIEPTIDTFTQGTIVQAGVLIFLLGLLIIPIRGGLGLAPINTGSAYFSHNQYANHAANNVVWNLSFSFTYYAESKKNPFEWQSKDIALATCDSLVNRGGQTKKILRIKRPNIILIIIESFNDKMIAPLGGMPGVTPNMNRYCKEGICFSEFYGNGDRSDKGLVAILSGFPAQPISSIIKFPYKTESLPFLTKDLKNAGYHSTFYYGGDIDFAAMRSYMQNAGFDELISDKDFPSSTYGAKWGVHDEFVFKKLYDDLENAKEPFFKALFTLSSHEPFDVPMKSKFNGSSEEQKFLNSSYYTDSCLGQFIEKLRKSKLWDSSLVIITADHGATHPYNTKYYECIRFKIPMLWLGGALNVKDSVVHRIGAQSDLAVTLLNQLNIEPQIRFSYGKDLLDDSHQSFAYYSFHSGFGFINQDGKVVYDNNSASAIYKEGHSSEKNLRIGKSLQQIVYADFLKR
jgi:phosphoglycerol transferase MdoB-like AlkP superfamily enzyme